jgi:two-component system, OmpR family, response regulator AdeR
MQTASPILVAEDEDSIAEILEAYLGREGFRVLRARNGAAALDMHDRHKPELVLLDIRMPQIDGVTVLETIRKHSRTPVIMLTALTEDVDKLLALRIGADDYIVKPFNPREVVARVHAVLRRTRSSVEHHVLRVRDLEIDLDARTVRRSTPGAEVRIELTPSQFALLARMAAAPRRAFRRAELLDATDPESEALERVVDSHVSHLRRKLSAAGLEGFLLAVRGLGYRLIEEP